MLKKIRALWEREVWEQDVLALPWPRRQAVFWLRILHVLGQDLTGGELTLRAMSLVYTTLLAIVPLLAFAFAVLKGLGVQNQLEPVILEFLAPLGTKGVEITGRIINFVDNVKAGVLGTLGLLLLLYTVISLVQKTEEAFNYVWRVREPRSFTERFSHYLSVILVGPLFVVSAFGITATFSSHTVIQHFMQMEPLGHMLLALAKTLPYLLVASAFTFAYMFVPHTHVRLRAALAGGVFAGILWELAGWAFAALTVSSTRLTAIYSSFAILVMFMMWIYFCWLILLVGAKVAFYTQNPELVRHSRGSRDIGGRALERIALHIMYLLGRNYHDNREPWSHEELARRLYLPTDTVQDVLDRLRNHGLVMIVAGRIPRYVPACDMGTLMLRDIIQSVRQNPIHIVSPDRQMKSVPQAEDIMRDLDQAIAGSLGDRTLRDLIVSDEKTGSEAHSMFGTR
ncbi:MAG TPA: YhjD/YihY/BrkB family envelope integrity protein [Gammaproteobacteria bacterium]|nr:YhjD/YihY/BrkB family envelope integrity protein [Gammaproteobacteria bacterium]